MVLHILGAPFRALAAFFGWVHAAFCALMDAEGRRAWAVILCGGCGVVMTVLATYAMWLDRDKPAYVFWLGTEAMGIILIVISAITGLLVKRDIGGSLNMKDGTGSFTLTDRSGGNDAGSSS